MTQAQFERYAIQPGDGDPLPAIGSGLRIVEAKIGRKWVRVRVPGEFCSRIKVTKWRAFVPHVRIGPDPKFSAVLAGLREYYRHGN